jgi:hypothetical protein
LYNVISPFDGALGAIGESQDDGSRRFWIDHVIPAFDDASRHGRISAARAFAGYRKRGIPQKRMTGAGGPDYPLMPDKT